MQEQTAKTAKEVKFSCFYIRYCLSHRDFFFHTRNFSKPIILHKSGISKWLKR